MNSSLNLESEKDEKIQKLQGLGEFEFGTVQSDLFLSEEGPKSQSFENRKLSIFYFVRKSNRKNAPYIVFFNGGPGFAATDMVVSGNYQGFLPNYNIVFIDQRGTGLSSKPISVKEIQFFTARYISKDADLIRRKLVGDKKWIVFGQSYGGVVARKYLEAFPNNTSMAFTHGSAKFNAFKVVHGTEVKTIERTESYFKRFPDDYQKLKAVKLQLGNQHTVRSSSYELPGKYLIDTLSIVFSITPDEKMREMFSSLNKGTEADDLYKVLKPMAIQFLSAGVLGAVVGHIDLMEGRSSKDLYSEVKTSLKTEGISIEDLLISKIRFDQGAVPLGEEMKEMDALFERKYFSSDITNLDVVSINIEENQVDFHIYGSTRDSLAYDAILVEQSFFKSKGNKRVFYHFSDGNHREWLQNTTLFLEMLKKYN